MGRLTRVLVALTRWGLGLCALLAVLVALYVSLGRELVPLVAEYRADVESKAEQALRCCGCATCNWAKALRRCAWMT